MNSKQIGRRLVICIYELCTDNYDLSTISDSFSLLMGSESLMCSVGRPQRLSTLAM